MARRRFTEDGRADSLKVGTDPPGGPANAQPKPSAPAISALASDATALADYGLDAADATLLAKETSDYETLIANPAAAISGRKALTAALRPKFREVAELLAKMDRIVLRFRKTEAGVNFAAAWKNARIIRDLGSSAPAEPGAPTPPVA